MDRRPWGINYLSGTCRQAFVFKPVSLGRSPEREQMVFPSLSSNWRKLGECGASLLAIVGGNRATM